MFATVQLEGNKSADCLERLDGLAVDGGFKVEIKTVGQSGEAGLGGFEA